MKNLRMLACRPPTKENKKRFPTPLQRNDDTKPGARMNCMVLLASRKSKNTYTIDCAFLPWSASLVIFFSLTCFNVPSCTVVKSESDTGAHVLLYSPDWKTEDELLYVPACFCQFVFHITSSTLFSAVDVEHMFRHLVLRCFYS